MGELVGPAPRRVRLLERASMALREAALWTWFLLTAGVVLAAVVLLLPNLDGVDPELYAAAIGGLLALAALGTGASGYLVSRPVMRLDGSRILTGDRTIKWTAGLYGAFLLLGITSGMLGLTGRFADSLVTAMVVAFTTLVVAIWTPMLVALVLHRATPTQSCRYAVARVCTMAADDDAGPLIKDLRDIAIRERDEGDRRAFRKRVDALRDIVAATHDERRQRALDELGYLLEDSILDLDLTRYQLDLVGGLRERFPTDTQLRLSLAKMTLDAWTAARTRGGGSRTIRRCIELLTEIDAFHGPRDDGRAALWRRLRTEIDALVAARPESVAVLTEHWPGWPRELDDRLALQAYASVAAVRPSEVLERLTELLEAPEPTPRRLPNHVVEMLLDAWEAHHEQDGAGLRKVLERQLMRDDLLATVLPALLRRRTEVDGPLAPAAASVLRSLALASGRVGGPRFDDLTSRLRTAVRKGHIDAASLVQVLAPVVTTLGGSRRRGKLGWDRGQEERFVSVLELVMLTLWSGSEAGPRVRPELAAMITWMLGTLTIDRVIALPHELSQRVRRQLAAWLQVLLAPHRSATGSVHADWTPAERHALAVAALPVFVASHPDDSADEPRYAAAWVVYLWRSAGDEVRAALEIGTRGVGPKSPDPLLGTVIETMIGCPKPQGSGDRPLILDDEFFADITENAVELTLEEILQATLLGPDSAPSTLTAHHAMYMWLRRRSPEDLDVLRSDRRWLGGEDRLQVRTRLTWVIQRHGRKSGRGALPEGPGREELIADLAALFARPLAQHLASYGPAEARLVAGLVGDALRLASDDPRPWLAAESAVAGLDGTVRVLIHEHPIAAGHLAHLVRGYDFREAPSEIRSMVTRIRRRKVPRTRPRATSPHERTGDARSRGRRPDERGGRSAAQDPAG